MEIRKLALTQNIGDAIYLNDKALVLLSTGINGATIEYNGKTEFIPFNRSFEIDVELDVTIKLFERTLAKAKILFFACDNVKILRESLYFSDNGGEL